MTHAFEYSGVPSLEVMSEAVRYNRWIENRIRSLFPSGAVILDFGSGTGEFLHRMATTHTVDALEADTSLTQQLSPPARNVYTTLEALPSAHYDGIYTINVLEHVGDDRDALQRLAACLKPGGRILIYVPALPWLRSSIDRSLGHFRRYRRNELREKVDSAGLAVERADYVDSLGVFGWAALKMLCPQQKQLPRGSVIFYDRFLFPLSRAMDMFCRRWFGKNLLVVARKN